MEKTVAPFWSGEDMRAGTTKRDCGLQFAVDHEAPGLQQIGRHILMVFIPSHPLFERRGIGESFGSESQRHGDFFKRSCSGAGHAHRRLAPVRISTSFRHSLSLRDSRSAFVFEPPKYTLAY